jgi:hypothetical protein
MTFWGANLVDVDVLVLLGHDGLEVTVVDVGDGEGLQHSGVGVSEVVVLDLELVGAARNDFLDSGGDISTTIEGAQNVESGGVGVELLALGNSHRSQNTIVGVDHVEELPDAREGIAESLVGGNEVAIGLVLLLGLSGDVLASVVSDENLDVLCTIEISLKMMIVMMCRKCCDEAWV